MRLPMRWAVSPLLALSLALTTHPVDAQLHVLLTNDDGWEAPGIRAMREALLRAGHRVTLVAPLTNRSGSSSSQTTGGVIDYYEQSEGVWAIDGSPADAVILALAHVLREDPPDLVVSGSNFGHNAGGNVIGSGTVGAALTAAQRGVPGIAVSVAVTGWDDFDAEMAALTFEAYDPAADFVVGLVQRLEETGGRGLLPPRAALNINYPAVGSERPAGVRFAPVASVRPFRQVVAVAGPTGPARISMAATDPSRAEPDSDYDLLSRGFVTISVLNGNLDTPQESWAPLIERLAIER